jgi:hypothetical protein
LHSRGNRLRRRSCRAQPVRCDNAPIARLAARADAHKLALEQEWLDSVQIVRNSSIEAQKTFDLLASKDKELFLDQRYEHALQRWLQLLRKAS